MDWDTLKAECLACRRCELCTDRTHVVFGQGVQTAEVLFVGEGPGQSEDEQGLPFVGRSGQLLDKYLFAIDLDRSKNCYIANIVKCRPPQNRDPLPTESEACMPWLREQFKLLQPKIVVCLGRIASQRMIRTDFSVTKEHGTFVQKNGVWFMGTFHPAALLRQAQNKPAAFADFVALREKNPRGVRAHILTSSPSPSLLSQCHLSRRERPWQKDEAHKNCQGLPLWGSWRAERD